MDRASLREGGVVKLWMSALGGEAFYEQDIPDCCKRDARNSGAFFECFSCGAVWQVAPAAEPEECDFAERPAERFVGRPDEERKGAA